MNPAHLWPRPAPHACATLCVTDDAGHARGLRSTPISRGHPSGMKRRRRGVRAVPSVIGHIEVGVGDALSRMDAPQDVVCGVGIPDTAPSDSEVHTRPVVGESLSRSQPHHPRFSHMSCQPHQGEMRPCAGPLCKDLPPYAWLSRTPCVPIPQRQERRSGRARGLSWVVISRRIARSYPRPSIAPVRASRAVQASLSLSPASSHQLPARPSLASHLPSQGGGGCCAEDLSCEAHASRG